MTAFSICKLLGYVRTFLKDSLKTIFMKANAAIEVGLIISGGQGDRTAFSLRGDGLD